MQTPRSYVVRVSRRTPAGFAGTVQDARTGRVAPFQTPEELWSALAGAPPTGRPGSARRRSAAAPDEAENDKRIDTGGNDEDN